MPKNSAYGKGKNHQEGAEPSPSAFKGQKPADVSAPRLGLGVPGHNRGKDGTR